MLILPQLSESAPLKSLAGYISNDAWWIEQKCDGHRLAMHISDGDPKPVNRRGNLANIPGHITAEYRSKDTFAGDWVFDGEWMGADYWVFDIMHAGDRSLLGVSYSTRRSVLEKIFTLWTPSHTHLVPCAKNVDDKKALIYAVNCQRGEGVMLKNVDAAYVPGKRSHLSLKCKFRRTVDCIVVDAKVDGKDNLVLGLLDGEKLVEVGKVTALAGDGPKVQVGDVVEVTYQNATDDDRLFQPTKPRLRTDKTVGECTLDQLVYTDKGVIA